MIPVVIVDTQGTMHTRRRQLTQISRDEVGVGGQREIPKGRGTQNETRICL